MRKFAAAAVLFVVSVGFVMAEEFRAVITKVDGNNVTFHKVTGGGKGKKGERGEAETLPLAAGAKIVKGSFSKEEKKLVAGDAVEGGIKNEFFAKDANVRITTDDDGKKITQILIFQFGKKGKKGKKGASAE